MVKERKDGIHPLFIGAILRTVCRGGLDENKGKPVSIPYSSGPFFGQVTSTLGDSSGIVYPSPIHRGHSSDQQVKKIVSGSRETGIHPLFIGAILRTRRGADATHLQAPSIHPLFIGAILRTHRHSGMDARPYLVSIPYSSGPFFGPGDGVGKPQGILPGYPSPIHRGPFFGLIANIHQDIVESMYPSPIHRGHSSDQPASQMLRWQSVFVSIPYSSGPFFGRNCFCTECMEQVRIHPLFIGAILRTKSWRATINRPASIHPLFIGAILRTRLAWSCPEINCVSIPYSSGPFFGRAEMPSVTR